MLGVPVLRQGIRRCDSARGLSRQTAKHRGMRRREGMDIPTSESFQAPLSRARNRGSSILLPAERRRGGCGRNVRGEVPPRQEPPKAHGC